MGLVYGGGNVGLMGAVADAVLAKRGRVIGVIPHSLEQKEVAHRGLTELHVCRTMHDRKRMMAERADAFIAANFPVPLSAKLAFLVFGPMMDVKLVFMYLSVFKRRFVTGMAVGLFFVIGALCYFWMHVA